MKFYILSAIALCAGIAFLLYKNGVAPDDQMQNKAINSATHKTANVISTVGNNSAAGKATHNLTGKLWTDAYCATPTPSEVSLLLEAAISEPSLLAGSAVLFSLLSKEDQEKLRPQITAQLLASDLKNNSNAYALISLCNAESVSTAITKLTENKPSDAGWRMLMAGKLLDLGNPDAWKLLREGANLRVEAWGKNERMDSINDSLRKIGRSEEGSLLMSIRLESQPLHQYMKFFEADLKGNLADGAPRSLLVQRAALALSETADSTFFTKSLAVQLEKFALNTPGQDWSKFESYTGTKPEDAAKQIREEEVSIQKTDKIELNFEKISSLLSAKASLIPFLSRVRSGGYESGIEYLTKNHPEIATKFGFSDGSSNGIGLQLPAAMQLGK